MSADRKGADTGEVEGLIARVESATGADRELDAIVQAHLTGGRAYPMTGEGPWPSSGRPWFVETEGLIHQERRYTASLDAVLALLNERLPGWGFYLRRDGDGCGAGLLFPEYDRVTPSHTKAATPALALLAALLRALNQDTRDDH